MEENLKDESSSKILSDRNKNEEKEVKIGKYLIKKTLGKGTFGKVKLGIYLPNKKKVAIKILEKKRLKEEDDIIRLSREFEMLTQFNHPNVISVSEIFENKDSYFTVMDYCEGGELFNYIVANGSLSEEKSAFFFYQLINGLEYIHSLGIVHRDLKPENLLLTKDHILKIIDFGLSNYFGINSGNNLLNTPCGSPCYASPEMLSGENYDGFKIDIWATGIILFAMLCGFLPFDHKDNDKLFMKILEGHIKYPNHLSKDAKDLIKKILTSNPRKRITIPKIKKHPFYLKGKKVFESNFTIYQSSQNDDSYIDESIIDDSISFENTINLFDWRHKSQILFNKYSDFYDDNLIINIKKNNSLEIKKPIINKKFLNFEKKGKNDKGKKEIDLNNPKSKNRIYLTYNNSTNFLIKNMSSFCKKIINQYKKEEKIKIKNKLDKPKLNSKKLNLNYKLKKITNNKEFDNNKKKPIKKSNDFTLDNNKSKEKDKNIATLENKMKYMQISPINNNNINTRILNKNIKANIKRMQPNKMMINKLFINTKKKAKINKLPNNIKSKNSKRKQKYTSVSNSKVNKTKNFLTIIKEKYIKPSIKIINKQNIIHHHYKHITNLTKKNYYSNIIINDFKGNFVYKNESLFQNTNKNPDRSIGKKGERTFFKEYKKVNTNPNQILNMSFKNKNKKMKITLQKEIFKDDIIPSAYNNNKKVKNSNDLSKKSLDEDKINNYLTLRNKKIINHIKDAKHKIFIKTNNKNQGKIRKKIQNLDANKYVNTIKNFNKTKNKVKDMLIEFSLLDNNNDLTINNNRRDNKYWNSIINNNNSAEIKNISLQKILEHRKKIDKIPNLNLNEKLIYNFDLINHNQLSKNSFNNYTLDNNKINFNCTDRNYHYNLNNLYNISTRKNYENKNTKKKSEKDINNRFKKINLKKLTSIDNLYKNDNFLTNDYHQNYLQTQRYENSIIAKINSKNIYKYNNPYLQKDSNKRELNNTSYNLDKNIRKNKANQISSPYFNKVNKIKNLNSRKLNELLRINKKIYSSLENKNKLINKTNDNIKINRYLLKSMFDSNNMKNLNDAFFKSIDDNNKNNIKQTKILNTKNINNKLLNINNKPIKTKINFNSNIFHNKPTDSNRYKINSQNNSSQKDKSDNKKKFSNHFKNNKKIELSDYNTIISNKNDTINNSNKNMINLKKNNKNVAESTMNYKKLNIKDQIKNVKFFNIENYNYNVSTTETNINTNDKYPRILNKKINPFDIKKKITKPQNLRK